MKFKHLALVAFFLSSIQIFAQKPPGPTLEVVGYCRDRSGVGDVEVTVYVNGKVFYKPAPSIGSGRFLLYLPFNKNFKVTIHKKGYVDYFFEAETFLQPGEERENMSMDLDIKMIPLPVKLNLQNQYQKLNFKKRKDISTMTGIMTIKLEMN